MVNKKCPIYPFVQKMGKKQILGNNDCCALYRAPIIVSLPYLPKIILEMGKKQ